MNTNSNGNLIASIGLAAGALFGMSGQVFTEPVTQTCLFVISGAAFTMGLVLLTFKYLRQKNDIVAAGFLLFSIGEAISTAATAADEKTALSAFAACMLFYIMGFLLVCLPATFPNWVRITGLVSATLFAIASTKFYLGYGIHYNDALAGIGYGLLTITIIGWIISLLKADTGKSKTHVQFE